MRLTGGQMVCESLLREGVDVVFGIPGGAMLPLYQTLPEYPQLRHILVRHEQGAAHAADGYARVTGQPGVAWATSGPGATNLVTGIATAYMDSVPMVVITAQVPRAAIGSDAFQEIDITGITLPVTKHNYLVMETADIPRVIREAFHIANTGRPGPVLVDIPKDVIIEDAEFEYPESVDLPGYSPTQTGHPNQIRRAARLIEQAERPVVLAGHGIILSRAYDELAELVETAQLPVVTSLLGIGSFPENHVLSVGMPGMHGVAYASLALEEADLIIALGSRFDDRITGDAKKFATKSKKIHVDVDPSEIGKTIPVDVPIVGDVKQVLQQLNKRIKPASRVEWIQRIDELKRDHPSLGLRSTDKLIAQYVIQQLSQATEGKAIIVTGVGQHQMWAAQHYTFTEQCSLISSGGSGTMGYEVPGAMGAQVGRPDKLVWSIAGDGGFQMTMAELATMAENNIPVKIAIMNNGVLGMVRQWQDLFYEQSFVATTRPGNPDFVKLADAFGIFGARVTDKSQVMPAILQAMEYNGPAIVDFVVNHEENVYPMIPSGMTVDALIEEPSPQEARR
ncbi:MAG: biosynthetic-type acetolactate synthase large subunit [SAR202 cluster bacterium]|jgi:acetolactate synthase-1/2/3 large subunit|nr:acetolactate synthase, large subunit, biosynthetic type [Chloroflexota bacterium]MDP6423030.1 biosynthetic-type acetolactate synthase large subunit [SAR202 cluster bacterium]MDP6663826.1 biosynthetic-type acetolactate synthase large subunit [SAR202 cluster bacterium]MQG56745.1 biosynthetic-type acetolactate synthase large subunit [SAR202 cluster bacterium]MQG70155.1 biosynthetic-type acetolactate synthase large subunit [SAR202 cluster bacterium]|tara:strand:+ start:2776 stop:4470 length:1695 start_codon:yes stop_codon:yes gene_type:complete